MPDPIGDPAVSQLGADATQQNTPALAPSKGGQAGMPNVVRLISGLISPEHMGVAAGQRPPSRLDVMENFLGNFVNALGQGMANAGHGPGANLRGAGAAIQAPQALAAQQAQIQTQQAQAQELQQRAGLTQAQAGLTGAQTQLTGTEAQLAQRRLQMMQQGGAGSDPITALGPLTADEQAVASAGMREAQLKGDSAPIAQAVQRIAQMRAVSGRAGSKVLMPDKNSSTGWSEVFFDRQSKEMNRVQGAAPPPGYAQSNTVSTDIFGNKSTSSTKRSLPGQQQQPAQPASGFPKPSVGGGGALPAQPNVKGPKGQELNEKALTYWQPALDSAERFNVMSQNYVDAVKNHDQQAMLSLLSNHLAMTMGLTKGARMNQALINEAMRSRPWLQGMETKFDKDGYLTGVTLSPEQMKQMVQLGAERYREDVKQSRSKANFIGVGNEPPRQLSTQGAAFYIQQAGGDKGKAMTMARTDGWTF